MGIVVMKFGGAAVATPAHFATIAELVIAKSMTKSVVVVVSAMQGMTNHLLELARQVHPQPPLREQDMLVSVGERISIALLAMALQLKGKQAISFTGSQSGILTTSDHSHALIKDVQPMRIQEALNQGQIVIVAGFQGVSSQKEITTLGRGGSDTSAVALGVAFGAECVEFYKDVSGIYSHDPKSHPQAVFYPELSYDQMLEILEGGARVLHSRCVRLAKNNALPLHVLCFHQASEQGTWIRADGAERCVKKIYEVE